MGTSIHLWVERRDTTGWQLVPRSDGRKADWERRSEDERRQRAESLRSLPPGPKRDRDLLLCTIRHVWTMGKNYRLFAVMADVRNLKAEAVRRGRHQQRWTEHVISPPRGFPVDASDAVLFEATYFLDASATRLERFSELLRNGESHSWLLLSELLEVDWDLATHGEGVVGEGEDFLVMLHEELVPLGPPDDVRLVFYFD